MIVAVALIVVWGGSLVATRNLKGQFIRNAGRGWKLYALFTASLPIAVGIGVVSVLALRGDLVPIDAVVVSLGGAVVADLWFTSVAARWRSQEHARAKFKGLLSGSEYTARRLSKIPILGALIDAVRNRPQ